MLDLGLLTFEIILFFFLYSVYSWYALILMNGKMQTIMRRIMKWNYNKTCLFVPTEGSINISNILTGKSLAKVKATNNLQLDECGCSDSVRSGRCNCYLRNRTENSRIVSSVAEALEDITALYYNEERNEIYTGNRLGLIHMWSNWGLLY